MASDRSGGRPMSFYLSIVIPLYNEEECVDKLVAKINAAGALFAFEYEVILVDDGSSDGTWERIEALRGANRNLKGIRFRRNYGQTAAMVAGFDHARGRVIVTMDGDLQNDPADITRLLEKIDEGYDIVSGWRKERKDHFARVLPSMVANRIISWSTGVWLHDYGCSLKAYRTECIRPIRAYGEMHRFFPALASMTGAQVTEIPVTHHPRKYGVSKYGFERIFKVFSDIFAMNLIIRFSSMPLKGFTLCAFPFALLSLVFLVLGGAAHLLDWSHDKAAFFLFTGGMSAMAVTHLVGLGILGELVIATSDLTHTQMPEITKKTIVVAHDGTCTEDQVLRDRVT